jgi:hypothetical protein
LELARNITGICADFKHRNDDHLDLQRMVNGRRSKNIHLIRNAQAGKDQKEEDEANGSWQHWARIKQITYQRRFAAIANSR